MPEHPYKNQDDYAFWSRSISRIPMADVDPVVKPKFRLSKADKVVTAGSCFAQHIARKLLEAGFNFHITESPHPLARKPMATKFGYGMFSARYGNIYTSRQLLQLLKRASGEFSPQEDVWIDDEGRYIDPFRPSVQPGGFRTLEEYYMDRRQHFDAVTKAFAEMEVFVFTLGLTECWSSKADGAVFPLCPGVVAGTFDSTKHEYTNLSVAQVTEDFLEFSHRILSINRNIRMILTVSPVPLVATAEKKHVLVSTTYSKSVLRVAADIIERELPQSIAYFPSYEIITGNFTHGKYFAEDLRAVTENGVEHVMRLFFRHYTHAGDVTLDTPARVRSDEHANEMRELVKVNCDEEALGADKDLAIGT
jgi:hypothetical protein